jgi:hypothetical protein
LLSSQQFSIQNVGELPVSAGRKILRCASFLAPGLPGHSLEGWGAIQLWELVMILKLHRQGVSVRQLGIHANTAHAHRRRADCGQLQNPAAAQTSFRFFRDLLTGSLAAYSGLTGRRVNSGDKLCQMAAQKGAMILFFFNDTATTEIYTLTYPLSLHDALPISPQYCARA